MKVLGVIPCRYNSSRFPGKPLADILGKSMVQRVYEKSSLCNNLNKVIVATDDERISFHVKSFSGEVIMTSKDHKSGTERCNEVFDNIEERFDVVVNIQGDEPFIDPEEISEVISLFKDEEVQIGTLAKPITDYEIYKNPDNPKVFFNEENIVTSFERNGKLNEEKFSENTFFQHIGIYAFKADILSEISELTESENEINENLEQLRWMDSKYKIKVGITEKESISVDREEDIEKIKSFHLKNS